MTDKANAPRRFDLSTSNKVMLVLFGGCAITLFFVRYGIELDSFAGHARGLSITLLCFVLLPGMCSWFIWLITGRRKNGGSWTYNIVLLVVAVGIGGAALDRAVKQADAGRERHSDAESGGVAVAADAHAGHDDVVDTTESKSRVDDVDREVAAILGELNDHVSGVTLRWSAAWRALQKQHFIDIVELNSAGDFQQQRRVVAEFLTASQVYREAIEMMGPEAEQLLAVAGASERAVQGLIKGIRVNRDRYSPYTKILDAHIEYAGMLNSILDFLEREQGQWRVEGKDIVFINPDNNGEWQRHFSSLLQLERQITRMGADLPAEGRGRVRESTPTKKTEVATSTSTDSESKTSGRRTEAGSAAQNKGGSTGRLTDAERERLRELKAAIERGREIEKNLSGVEKEVIEVMFAYYQEFDLKYKNWTNSAVTAMATPAGGYSRFKDKKSVEHQRSVLETFAAHSSEFLEFLKTAPRRYEGQLLALDSSHPALVKALTELRAQFQHSVQFKPYIAKSGEYGKQLSEMLDFLETRIDQRGSRYGNAEALGNVDKVPDWKKMVNDATKTELELAALGKSITDALARN